MQLLLAIAGLVALFFCLLLLGKLAEDIRQQEANALDAIATPLLHGLANPTLDALMRALTNLGSAWIVAPLFVVALALFLWRQHRLEALFLIVSVAGSLALNESLKLAFHRARPQLAWAQIQPDYSFPSGHAMNSLVFYVALALIVWGVWGRRAGRIATVLAIGLAFLIGTSRIYLSYQNFTDVVAAILAGATWLLIVLAAFDGGRWLRRRRSKGRSVP